VVVSEYSAVIDHTKTGAAWTSDIRDRSVEIVVPLSVLGDLGRHAFAGQLVCVSSLVYSPKVKHVARIIPIDICKEPLLSPAAAKANAVDLSSCTIAGEPVALISPVLAFNLGIPYAITQLMHLMAPSSSHPKTFSQSTISLSVIRGAWPDDRQDCLIRTVWTPGNSQPSMHAAQHVGLALCSKAEIMPPFNIEDYQESIQEAARKMQGLKPSEDEKLDQLATDKLSEQEHAQRDKDTMDVRSLNHFFRIYTAGNTHTLRSPGQDETAVVSSVGNASVDTELYSNCFLQYTNSLATICFQQ
jgi:hypothetical protein